MQPTDRVYRLKAVNDDYVTYLIYSPADHCIIAFDSRWQFNGDMEHPTFSPSMLEHGDARRKRTHFFLTNGVIKYLEGPGAGMSIECPMLKDWPEPDRSDWLDLEPGKGATYEQML